MEEFYWTIVLAALERGDWSMEDARMQKSPADCLPECSLTGSNARSVTLIQINSCWKTYPLTYSLQKYIYFYHSLLTMHVLPIHRIWDLSCFIITKLASPKFLHSTTSFPPPSRRSSS